MRKQQESCIRSTTLYLLNKVVLGLKGTSLHRTPDERRGVEALRFLDAERLQRFSISRQGI